MDPTDDRVGPDQGPLASAGIALGLAAICAIGAASMTAIALAATFEVVVILPRPFERYQLTGCPVIH